MNTGYIDAIRGFEGFTPKADWDYAQFTNGYGTRAKFAGEVIDPVEADHRFQTEIAQARAFVDAQVPNADEGTKAALTSLTFNAGTAWSHSGLGDSVRRGDLDSARALFLQYDKAGGQVLPGLLSRRTAEAMWIGNPDAATGAAVATPLAQDYLPPLTSAAPVSPGSSAVSPDPASSHTFDGAPAVGTTNLANGVSANADRQSILQNINQLQVAMTTLLAQDALSRVGQADAESSRTT